MEIGERMDKSNCISIVVVSCDNYLDIVREYLHYFELNWPNCNYRLFIATEEKYIDSSIAEFVLCGTNTTWTQRAIKAINSCDSPYILLSVDDLFISEKVDTRAFDEIESFIFDNNILYYRIPVFKVGSDSNNNYPGNENVERIEKNRRYNISIGTSIWERNELLSILGDGSMSAWDLENYFLKNAELASPGYLEGYVADKRFLLHSVHMIKSGKWIPTGVKQMKKKGYRIDTSIRGYIGIMDRLKLNWFYSYLSRKLPTNIRGIIKRVMRKMGFRFASE